MYLSILPALLFFILSPGILTRIPKNGSKYLVTFVHSIIFAVLFHFLMRNLPIHEGMMNNNEILLLIVEGMVGVTIVAWFLFWVFYPKRE